MKPTETAPHLEFAKLVATGNDFVFIDARKSLPAPFCELSRSHLARRICERHFGVGADGVVFVESGEGSLLRWDFYNSDGSAAEMCGNATRCMGRWAEAKMGVLSVEFETRAGRVTASVGPEGVASHLSFVRPNVKPLLFTVDGLERKAHLVHTGVPHVVVPIEDIRHAEQAQREIQALRFHPAAGEKGANVTFLEMRAKGDLSTVTFERGIEGFTLSCGTGVLAAAAVGIELTQKHLPGAQQVDQSPDQQEQSGLRGSPRRDAHTVEVQTPGGTLWVRFEEGAGGATLTGPADLIFEGRLSQEVVK